MAEKHLYLVTNDGKTLELPRSVYLSEPGGRLLHRGQSSPAITAAQARAPIVPRSFGTRR
jgi:hypothetical protein